MIIATIKIGFITVSMKITRAFYDVGGRKYIEVDHQRIKVPWRYNRVMGVEQSGMIPVQMLQVGTDVQVEVVIKQWDSETFKVLKKISAI
jgi:hypothetical protein